MNAGEELSFCSNATNCAAEVGTGVFTSTTWVRGFGRKAPGSRSGRYTWAESIATSTAATAVIAAAILRHRRARCDRRITLELSTVGIGEGATGSSGAASAAVRGGISW